MESKEFEELAQAIDSLVGIDQRARDAHTLWDDQLCGRIQQDLRGFVEQVTARRTTDRKRHELSVYEDERDVVLRFKNERTVRHAESVGPHHRGAELVFHQLLSGRVEVVYFPPTVGKTESVGERLGAWTSRSKPSRSPASGS